MPKNSQMPNAKSGMVDWLVIRNLISFFYFQKKILVVFVLLD